MWLVISATSLRLSQRKEVEFQVEQANQPPQQRQGASKRAELRDQQRGSIKQIMNAGLSSVFPKRMDSAMKKNQNLHELAGISNKLCCTYNYASVTERIIVCLVSCQF